MPTHWLTGLLLASLILGEPSRGQEAANPGLPVAASGWTMEPGPDVGGRFTPANAALVAAPGGTVFIGVNEWGAAPDAGPAGGSILAVGSGSRKRYADRLGPISGLEWSGGSLYVLHGTCLSVLRDGDGDGAAEQRLDLVTGLGHPAAGSRDHPVAGGLRLGLDGNLYFAVDDRGLPKATAADRIVVTLQGGGVLRVRPDGTGLRVVSTGERCPRSISLDTDGEILTLGDPDPSGRWPGGLTHHIEGGHYGFPYQFLTAPFRSLPVVGGGVGGAGGQIVLAEGQGEAANHGSFLVCDPRAQHVLRLQLQKAGGTFRMSRKGVVVEPGRVPDFRPVSIAVAAEGDGFWIADAATPGATPGRLYRLRPAPAAGPRRAPRPEGAGIDQRIEALDHPAPSLRLEAQRLLAGMGDPAVGPLVVRLRRPGRDPGRVHALWALDAIGTATSRAAIREVLRDSSPGLRAQAARSCGRGLDRNAAGALARLLDDRDAAARREAAVALGRLGDRAAIAPLMDHLADPDRFAAWSIRAAIRRLGYPGEDMLLSALVDPRRREAALMLADEAWSVPVARALVAALGKTGEPEVRGRIVACLAGQYRASPEWTGAWWGPDPLAGKLPAKTRDWDAEGADAVLRGLRLGLADRDASVRFQSIFALGQVGPPAGPALRAAVGTEQEPRNLEALVETLGLIRDPASIDLLRELVADARRPEPVRAAALDGLAPYRGPDVLRTRLSLAYDPAAPPSLVARALPPLARAGILPPNDLAGFLEHASPEVRAAALLSLNPRKAAPADIRHRTTALLHDPAPEVRQAAILAAGALRLTEAVPRLIAIASRADDDLRPHAVAALCRMPDPRAIGIYRAASRESDPALRRLAEGALALLPPPADPATRPASTTKPGPVPELTTLRRFALGHQGDPRKGEELFREKGAASCARCHDNKRAPGPNLAGFARGRTRAELVDALLTPRDPVARAHQPLGPIESVFSALELTDLISYLQVRK